MSTQQLPQFVPCNCAAGACTGACNLAHGGGGPGLVAACSTVHQVTANAAAAAEIWAEAQRINDVPDVHQALQVFSEDATGDNGTGVVAAVLSALLQELLTAPDGRNAPALSIAQLKKVKALADAALDWSCERAPLNPADAELLKAVWTHTGPYTGPCEGCDGECDEPCATSRTVEEAHASIDASLKARQEHEAETRRVSAERVERVVARCNKRLEEMEAEHSRLRTAAQALHNAVAAATAPFTTEQRALADVVRRMPAVQVPPALLLPVFDALRPVPVGTPGAAA